MKKQCKGCDADVPKGNSEYCSRACSNRYRPAPLIVRFWAKVKRATSGDCWEWVGARNAQGYGTFWAGPKNVKAHRFSYERVKGPIPAGLDVMHKCDNPPCVNPDHLEPGTRLANVRDIWARGRGNPSRGAANGNSRLTSDGTQRIREMAWLGYSTAHMAEMFRVSTSQIRRVVRGTAGGWR